jgi:hypothetical protein
MKEIRPFAAVLQSLETLEKYKSAFARRRSGVRIPSAPLLKPRGFTSFLDSTGSEFEGNNPRGPCVVEKKRVRPSHKREPVGLKTCGFRFTRYYIY